MIGIGLNLWRRGGSGIAYPGHNLVVFDGTNDYMTIAANPFGVAPEYFSAAFYVQPESLAGATNHNLWWANAQMVLRIAASTGIPAAILQNVDGTSFNLSVGTQAVIAGQPNLIQVAARSATSYSDSYAEIWVNGVSSQATGGSPGASGGFLFNTYSQWGLFATYAGGSKFGNAGGPAGGSAGLAWITAGATAAHYLRKETYDFNNIRDLGIDGSAPGVTPIVFYGGAQTAANWNAGTNQGSGSDWTMQGDGVA